MDEGLAEKLTQVRLGKTAGRKDAQVALAFPALFKLRTISERNALDADGEEDWEDTQSASDVEDSRRGKPPPQQPEANWDDYDSRMPDPEALSQAEGPRKKRRVCFVCDNAFDAGEIVCNSCGHDPSAK